MQGATRCFWCRVLLMSFALHCFGRRVLLALGFALLWAAHCFGRRVLLGTGGFALLVCFALFWAAGSACSELRVAFGLRSVLGGGFYLVQGASLCFGRRSVLGDGFCLVQGATRCFWCRVLLMSFALHCFGRRVALGCALFWAAGSTWCKVLRIVFGSGFCLQCASLCSR